jgi:lipid A 4'-phosphatase
VIQNKKWLLLAMLAIIIFIILLPKIDQYLASLSYTPATRTFYGERALWCKVVYYFIPVIVVSLILMPLIWLFMVRNDSEKYKTVVKFSQIVYLALILGPGLVVNVVFKEHWGRPRPYQVLRDGKQYAPFWQPHFSDKENNSFPGGHASIGFFLGIPLLALRRKKLAVIFSLLGGALVGSVRILQGGHYFSDVIFSGIFVWLTGMLVIYTLERLWKD